MARISIIGSGNMGQAISSVLTKAGNDVTFVGHDPAEAVDGDIVVLAVYYPSVAGILAARSEQLAGKIVVDITNPVDFDTFDGLVVPADSSAAAEIQAQLPGSRVLKAFNTTFAGTLASGVVGPLTTTILVAGDDAEAKAEFTRAVEGSGVRVIDAGSLKRARELEAMGFLQISLAAGEKFGWDQGFGVIA